MATQAVSADGASTAITLAAGRHEVGVYATSWDTDTKVDVQYAMNDTEAQYNTLKFPGSDGPLTYRSNGATAVVESGGGYLRAYVTNIGTTSGLTLEAKATG